jgi:hypothetical protein
MITRRGDDLDIDIALRLGRQVRKDLDDMLTDIRGRDFFDVSSEVGMVARRGWAFDKMGDELDILENFLSTNDLESIGQEDWSLCDLVNFYDHLIDTIEKHPSSHRSDLVKDALGWRKRAGALCQMVGQIEDID